MTTADAPFEIHATVESAGDGAVELLHRHCGVSRQKIKSAMTKGAVWISRDGHTQRLRRASRKLRAGDELHLYYDQRVLAKEPAEPDLIADAGGYSVWNKPCGLRSQGSRWGDHCTLCRWAEQNLRPERPAFTVHRLDRAANGLMLVAHSKRIAAALSGLFRNREVTKHYRAWVNGDFSAYENSHRLDDPIDGKSAVSEVAFVRLYGDRSLLDVRIETGRKHQVRRHLSTIGFPVTGDRLYGAGEKDGVDLQLTAYLLGFRCPIVDELVEYRLPPGDSEQPSFHSAANLL